MIQISIRFTSTNAISDAVSIVNEAKLLPLAAAAAFSIAPQGVSENWHVEVTFWQQNTQQCRQ